MLCARAPAPSPSRAFGGPRTGALLCGLRPEPRLLSNRFIHQVSQAAVTIQRWYRHQVQQHQVGAAHLEHLLASKREVSVGVSHTLRDR